MPTSSPTAEVWDAIADAAAAESPLWAQALRPPGQRERLGVFSALAEPRFALGLETIYEGYLAHYGRPRLFAPPSRDTALLLGDYLYAHGLVHVSALGHVPAVADLAELLALCAQLRADGSPGDGAAWAATAALLGEDALEPARSALRLDADPEPLLELAREAAGAEAVDGALALHRARVS